jgi:hypothetical protein
MYESFFAKVVHAIVFLAICTAIIFVGWREPLRYRFMSADEITEEHQPVTPREVPKPVEKWRARGSALDRAPVGEKHK